MSIVRFVGANLLLGLALALSVGAPNLQAQQLRTDGPRDSIEAVAITRRIPAISPNFGPAGTEVVVNVTGLPAVTPVQIGIGATRAGFEVIERVMTNAKGEFTQAVRIPDWVEKDRSHLFVIVDMYFRPISSGGAYHVTGTNGTFRIQGLVQNDGQACPSIRTEFNDLYGLSGPAADLKPGDWVTVEGSIATSSTCPQATTINFVRIDRGN